MRYVLQFRQGMVNKLLMTVWLKICRFSRVAVLALIIPVAMIMIGTANAQEGQRYQGAEPHGGASSPHGSGGDESSAAQGQPDDGALQGGGRSGFGYWGGRHVPEGPGGGGTDPGTVPGTEPGSIPSTEPPESGGATSYGYGSEGVIAGSCEDIQATTLLPEARLSGQNLQRINIVGAYLASTITEEQIRKSGSPRINLANYQEELLKARPDYDAAGIYLGLVATKKVTPDVVDKINAALCVETDQSQSAIIAKVAEEQRHYLIDRRK